MRCRSALLIVVGLGLASCGDSPSATDESIAALDGQPANLDVVATTTTVTVVASQSRDEVYRMAIDFLSQVVPANPGLAAAVQDLDTLATCMVNAGYQINNIPPEGATNTPTTLVAPSTMIAPMLTYLAETCSGVPVGQWAKG